MREIRVVLLFVGLAGLAIFAIQNWSQSFPLAFLGMQSVALPLSVWVLAAILAGAVTAWMIGGLLSLSNLTPASSTGRPGTVSSEAPREPLRRRADTPVTISQADTILQEDRGAGTSNPYRDSFRTQPRRIDAIGNRQAFEDDELESSPDIDEDEFYEDWEEQESATRSQREVEVHQTRIEKRTYEMQQEPKERSWSGSVYSYTYREQQDADVEETDEIQDEPEIEIIDKRQESRERPDLDADKPESVYDADYRIIQPPAPPTPPAPESASESQNRPPQKSEKDWEWGEEKRKNLNEW